VLARGLPWPGLILPNHHSPVWLCLVLRCLKSVYNTIDLAPYIWLSTRTNTIDPASYIWLSTRMSLQIRLATRKDMHRLFQAAVALWSRQSVDLPPDFRRLILIDHDGRSTARLLPLDIDGATQQTGITSRRC
jgi:hypothetical protein